MKAVIFKELREHGKWAVLIAGVFALALGSSVYYRLLLVSARERDYWWDDFSGKHLSIVFLGAVIVGLLLGFAQTYFENRSGAWEFVRHRPLSAPQIFIGKVMAGLGLYTAAIIAPIAIMLIWALSGAAGPFY